MTLSADNYLAHEGGTGPAGDEARASIEAGGQPGRRAGVTLAGSVKAAATQPAGQAALVRAALAAPSLKNGCGGHDLHPLSWLAKRRAPSAL